LQAFQGVLNGFHHRGVAATLKLYGLAGDDAEMEVDKLKLTLATVV